MKVYLVIETEDDLKQSNKSGFFKSLAGKLVLQTSSHRNALMHFEQYTAAFSDKKFAIRTIEMEEDERAYISDAYRNNDFYKLAADKNFDGTFQRTCNHMLVK